MKEQNKQVSHHLSILVVPTSCIISFETFYPNEMQLHFKLHRNFCFPSSQTAEWCCLPGHLALPALAVCLTCLGATTHPVLRGEKGDPLRFKPLITPVGQTKQGLVGKRSWKGAELHGKSLTPLTALTGSHLLWRDGIETHCAIRLHQHLSSPVVFSWQINRAPQGIAPSSQGGSTWPPALWVSGLSGCQTANWRSFTRSAGEPICRHCPPFPGSPRWDDPPAWLWKCTGTFKKW